MFNFYEILVEKWIDYVSLAATYLTEVYTCHIGYIVM